MAGIATVTTGHPFDTVKVHSIFNLQTLLVDLMCAVLEKKGALLKKNWDKVFLN